MDGQLTEKLDKTPEILKCACLAAYVASYSEAIIKAYLAGEKPSFDDFESYFGTLYDLREQLPVGVDGLGDLAENIGNYAMTATNEPAKS